MHVLKGGRHAARRLALIGTAWLFSFHDPG